MRRFACIMLVVFFLLTSVGCDPENEFPGQGQAKNEICKNLCEVDLEYEAAIRDRFQTGFNNWNQGYAAWLEWCDELYDDNAYYNVYGHRLSLDQYKRMMGAMFEQFEIMLGGLGDDAGDIANVMVDSMKGMGSIQYAVSFKKKTETEWVTLNTMEFVQFRKDEKFGAKVVEGWAISDTQIEPDDEVMAFWMNPANDWDVLLERVANWK